MKRQPDDLEERLAAWMAARAAAEPNPVRAVRAALEQTRRSRQVRPGVSVALGSAGRSVLRPRPIAAAVAIVVVLALVGTQLLGHATPGPSSATGTTGSQPATALPTAATFGPTTAVASPTASQRPAATVGTFTIPASSRTGVATLQLQSGDLVAVSASGRWCMGGTGATAECGGPGGIRAAKPSETDVVLPGSDMGALIGRVDSGAWFGIAGVKRFRAPASGALVLAFNDRACCYRDNSGSVKVTVSAGP